MPAIELQVVATQTTPDEWSFSVTGVSAATFTVDYADGSAVETVTTDVSGTTVITHAYTDPGHHDYGVTFTAAIAHLQTLQQLADAYPAPDTLTSIAVDPDYPTLREIARTHDVLTVPVVVDVGPATIDATVLDAVPVPLVQVDVWIGDPETVTSWTVYRDVAGVGSVPIFLGSSTTGAISLIDPTPPLGVQVTYRLQVTYTAATPVTVLSAPVVIAGTVGCFLTSADGATTLPVILQAWPARVSTPRQAIIPVLSREDPVGLTDVHNTPTGSWTIHTRTDAETAALLALLKAIGAVVVLRTQPGSSIASCTVLVGEVNERRMGERGGDPRRLVDVEIQEIAPIPATAFPLPATLAGLSTLATTLGGLSPVRRSLLQLSMIRTGA